MWKPGNPGNCTPDLLPGQPLSQKSHKEIINKLREIIRIKSKILKLITRIKSIQLKIMDEEFREKCKTLTQRHRGHKDSQRKPNDLNAIKILRWFICNNVKMF